MEEGLFLDGIALHPCGVSPGRVERAAAIEAHFADAGLAFGNRTAVTAGETPHAVVFEAFVERVVSLVDFFVEDVPQGGQSNLLRYCSLRAHGRRPFKRGRAQWSLALLRMASWTGYDGSNYGL